MGAIRDYHSHLLTCGLSSDSELWLDPTGTTVAPRWAFRISRQVRHLRDLYFSKAPRVMILKQPLAFGNSLLLTSSSEGFILKALIVLLMLLYMPASAEDNKQLQVETVFQTIYQLGNQ